MTLKPIVGRVFFEKNKLYLKNPYYALFIAPVDIIFELGGNNRFCKNTLELKEPRCGYFHQYLNFKFIRSLCLYI